MQKELGRGLHINVGWGSIVWMSDNVIFYDSRLGNTEAISISDRNIHRISTVHMLDNVFYEVGLEL
jgi:hypothetical protein